LRIKKNIVINKFLIKNIFIILIIISISGCIDNNQIGEWGNAPDINLKTVYGDNFNLSSNLGKIIIIDFMYVNCPPCQLQMGELKKINEEFKEKIIIISISVLGAGDTNNDLINFKDYYNANWIFALDTIQEDATIRYNVLTVPKILIINKQGDIQYTHSGYTKSDIIINQINNII
jgi:cytochrome oxidase Cu insertion factor (SCO1/SenC/PrrC family)